jgi:branched-subunit amino acid ABC-type transport system permease component
MHWCVCLASRVALEGEPMQIAILSIIRASDFALIAIGFALVFGSCRVLNLMHGSYVMLGGYAAYWFSALIVPQLGSSPRALALAVLLAATTIALFGYASFKLLQLTNRTQPHHVLVISIAGNLFLSRAVAYRWGVEGLNVPPIIAGTVTVGSLTVPSADALRFLAAVCLIAGLWLWLSRSQPGRVLRAVADNPLAARLSGIDPARYLALGVGIAAFLAGLAGALRAPAQTLSPNMWVHPLLVSFAVVVFGGRNSFAGAILSAALLGVLETVVSYSWSESAANHVALFVIIAGLMWRPSGLAALHRYETR